MYKIQYDASNSLKKDKEKLFKDFNNSKKIKKAIEKLSIMFPDISNIKRLEPKEKHKFRYRIGDYRVIFGVDYGNKIIIIYRIALRKEIYK